MHSPSRTKTLSQSQDKSKSNILDEVLTADRVKPKKWINTTITPTSPHSSEGIAKSAGKKERTRVLLKQQKSFNEEDLMNRR